VFGLLNTPPIPKAKAPFSLWPRAWLALVTQGNKNNEAPTLVYQTPEQQPQPKKK
jgi:hypothetical protein